MKLLQAIALASLLFASCTKEVPATVKQTLGKNVVTMSGSFDDWNDGNEAGIKKDGKIVSTGHWTYNGKFIDSISRQIEIVYYQINGNNESEGDIMFMCKFEKPDFLKGRYTGKGEWYIEKSEGALESQFKSGAGTLAYYQQEPETEEEPTYRNVELTGYTKK